MDPAKQLLTTFGLTSNEATLYVYALSKTSIAAQAASRDTGIPRPTVYHALESLVQKGFLTKMEKAHSATFIATHPARLPSLLEQERTALARRQDALNDLLPFLLKELTIDSHPLKALHYEGLNGVKLLFEEALYCKKPAWDIIAPSQNILRQVDTRYASYVYETQRQRGIKLRSLWENKPHTTKHSEEEIARRNIRLMPEAMTGKFSSLIVLFDDACAFVPPLEDGSAILLRSTEVHATFRAIFDGLWQLATPYSIKK
jgi:DNA-binding MarR family transcriptional regulator